MTQSQRKMGLFGDMSEIKLNELRKMIVGLDTEDLQRLAMFVNDPEAFSAEISGLLPNSIKLMLEKGNISLSALMPVVESALKDSVKKNPSVLADVLFPIMMPAIRKAVTDDLSRMIESLNTTLENSFSPKRLGWRLKSMFSSKSYAEIILSNAYIFRVKQVFLIHKQTGLLLADVADNENTVTKDADMVTSMLSAIKDFVQDSFDVGQTNELDTIRVGQFNIWIEQGPSAIIAAIVEGNAPAEYRVTLKNAIEKIHLKQSYELENFSGDVDAFKKAEPYIKQCVLSEQKEKKKKKPIIIIILFIVILGLASYWTYISIDTSIRISKLETALKNEAGIIVTNNERHNGKVIFEGLRDPVAADPTMISNANNVDTSEVSFALKPYLSLEDDIVLKRAYQVLKPPKTVTLLYKNKELYAKGGCNQSWLEMAVNNYDKIAGVIKFNVNSLTINDIPDTVSVKKLSIEDYYFVFNYKTVALDSMQKVKFNNLISEVNSFLNFDFTQDSVPVIVVIAHTSYLGNTVANKKVAFRRAKRFIALMEKAGIPTEVLVPKTSFIENAVKKFPARSVSFKIIYSKPEDL